MRICTATRGSFVSSPPPRRGKSRWNRSADSIPPPRWKIHPKKGIAHARVYIYIYIYIGEALARGERPFPASGQTQNQPPHLSTCPFFSDHTSVLSILHFISASGCGGGEDGDAFGAVAAVKSPLRAADPTWGHLKALLTPAPGLGAAPTPHRANFGGFLDQTSTQRQRRWKTGVSACGFMQVPRPRADRLFAFCSRF